MLTNGRLRIVGGRPWFRAALSAVLACSCGVVAACSDAHPIRPTDSFATRTYLNARSELERATTKILPVIRERSETFVSNTVRECPDVATAVPRNASFGVMSVEATRAPAAVMRQTNRAAIREFDHAVADLRWSDPRLTLLVHDLAIREDAAVNVRAPDLCADLKRWSDSEYRTIPASTSRYNSRTADVLGMGTRSIEAAAEWWHDHLPANQRGICRRFPRGGHRRGYIEMCSGGLAEPVAVARERRAIEASRSVGKAIRKLLAHYEDGSTQSLAHHVERRDAELQGALKQTYGSLVSRLSQSVGFEKVLLPTEFELLGLPGAN